jgi:hypothetical protein
VLTPSQKGSIAESAIVAAAIKLGVAVFKPVNEGLRYDLIFGLAGELVRVQCKWAVRRGDAVVLPCVSRRRCADGFINRPYTADEIDAYAAYCDELDRCYFVPIAQFPTRLAIQLRIGPARNNQRRGINRAEADEIGATLPTFGAEAQLGERRAGSA